jgi:5-methyltetrahydropteroyltriglutamate--homocysteine methyltransferase
VRTSTDRILTTHTGSLPRPVPLVDLIFRRDRGEAVEDGAFQRAVREAVAAAVERQVAAGIDVVSDGEMRKINYVAFTGEHLTGFEGEVVFGAGRDDCPPPRDLVDFPGYLARFASSTNPIFRLRRCTGEIRYVGAPFVKTDLDNLKSATAGHPVTEAFLNSTSPGNITLEQPNEYYPSYEKYVWALAAAMQPEYEAIAAGGVLLQIDSPEFAMGRHLNLKRFRDDAEFLKDAEMRMDALNHALQKVPPEQIRLHVCWGNWEGPHHHDIDLRKIIATVLRCRAQGLSFEAANPRHGHEWKVFREAKVPEDKVLLPGVIDVHTNCIEHPELVADRIVQFADLVGRERVIASTDCGFGTFAGQPLVDPDIAYAKLAALAEGAALATQRLW